MYIVGQWEWIKQTDQTEIKLGYFEVTELKHKIDFTVRKNVDGQEKQKVSVL